MTQSYRVFKMTASCNLEFRNDGDIVTIYGCDVFFVVMCFRIVLMELLKNKCEKKV